MVLWKKTMIIYQKPLNFDLLCKNIWCYRKKNYGTMEKNYDTIPQTIKL